MWENRSSKEAPLEQRLAAALEASKVAQAAVAAQELRIRALEEREASNEKAPKGLGVVWV